jgi:DNA-directed RNA polymerase subunit RPC12/RpoP
MGIGDWLYRKRRDKENLEEFDRMMKEYDSSPLPEGKLIQETGETICPNCGHKLSLVEGIKGRGLGAVGATECPHCSKLFKQH